jgi:hypothetical protein
MASFVSRSLALSFAIAACVLVRPCLADPAATSTSTPTTPTCTLLMGGGGTVTPDKDVNSHWFSLNSILSRNLVSALSQLGYRVQDFITDIPDADARGKALEDQVYKTGCWQVLRLTHELTAIPDKPGSFSKFTFVVSVFHLEQSPNPAKVNARIVKIAEKYEMAYQYEMTPQVIGKLSLTDLAQSMAADVVKASVLEK